MPDQQSENQVKDLKNEKRKRIGLQNSAGVERNNNNCLLTDDCKVVIQLSDSRKQKMKLSG